MVKSSERRHRDRRRPNRKTFSAKQFFRDYPIVPVVMISFAVGLTAGYFWGYGNKLARNGVSHEILNKMATAAPATPAPVVSVPVPKKPPQKIVDQKRDFKPALFKRDGPKPVTPKSNKPQIAFVIDDVGYNQRYADLLFSIKKPVTLAILPRVAYSKYYCDEAKKRNLPVLLHLPLEPGNAYDDPGPGAILNDMNVSEIKQTLEDNLASVPTAIGVNNHMGSLATQNRSVMYSILKEIKNQDLFFLDSLTHPNSVGYQVGFGLGIPVLKRDVFLDNVDDIDYISNQIRQAAQVAKQSGRAIAIGHPKNNTLLALKEMIPKLEDEGFEIVPITDFFKDR